MKLLKVKSKGVNQLALIVPIMKKLNVAGEVDRCCGASPTNQPKASHGSIIEALIANRLTSPTPMYSVSTWAEDLAIEETLGIPPELLNDDRIARTLDALDPHIQEIEAAIAVNAITEFKVGTKLVHWDITTLLFHGEYEESEIVKFGYSRDHRPDKKQVATGLDVTHEGVPLMHEIYPGNTPDQKTVESNMKALQASLKESTFIVVGDRKMLEGENLRALVKRCKFVGTLKLNNKLKDMVASVPREDYEELSYRGINGAKFFAAERTPKGLGVRAIIVWSEDKASRDAKNRKKKLGGMLKALKKIKGKLNTRRYKSKSYVLEQIKKVVKGAYKKCIRWELSGEEGELRLNYTIDREELARVKALEGKYVLATNVEEYSREDVLRAYKSHHEVENAFKNLKQCIRIRPIFLHKDARIRALVFITVLALMVYSLLQMLCRRQGMQITTRTLFWLFRRVNLLHLFLQDGDLWLLEEPPPPLRLTLDKLGLPHPEQYISVLTPVKTSRE
mgnify:CR=1 FL=1